MGKEIFDQDRPKSALARGLQDAFDGCEKWTTAPRQRRSTIPPPVRAASMPSPGLSAPPQQL
jgi:hypothetical protein